jgi:APA family basic amino acid/polyamine antiporter
LNAQLEKSPLTSQQQEYTPLEFDQGTSPLRLARADDEYERRPKRHPFAMARDGYFFAFAKRVQPLYRTPSGAIFFQACVAVLLVLTGTYQELYSFEMFAIWLFFALTAIALIRLRITEPELPRSYRVWGYPWTVLVFGIAGLAISLNLWLARPVRSSIGMATILLGLPFFYYWRRRAAEVLGTRAVPAGA